MQGGVPAFEMALSTCIGSEVMTPVQRLVVARKLREAAGVVSLELRDPTGQDLPRFTPGAHIEIELRVQQSGKTIRRSYSLCNNALERDRYLVAIARAAGSTGGSAAVHDAVQEGDILAIEGPRNNFSLREGAAAYLFIAGGIGITPIIPMIEACEASGVRWRLHYGARSRESCAFRERLSAYGEQVTFHFDDEAGRPVDVPSVLSGCDPRTDVYCCGPDPLMKAVKACALESGLGEDQLHFEWFAAPVSTPVAGANETEFRLELVKSGFSIIVKTGQTIVEALEEAGCPPTFSCREGICGACETTVLSGDVDHRDHVLTDREKRAGTRMMICVSRSKSPVLRLDL